MKDEFYYQDLIYIIKGLAQLQDMDNTEVNERIINREQPKEVFEHGERKLLLADFSVELMDIINSVGKRAGAQIKNFYDIRFYPEVVWAVIEELEDKCSLVRY